MYVWVFPKYMGHTRYYSTDRITKNNNQAVLFDIQVCWTQGTNTLTLLSCPFSRVKRNNVIIVFSWQSDLLWGILRNHVHNKWMITEIIHADFVCAFHLEIGYKCAY